MKSILFLEKVYWEENCKFSDETWRPTYIAGYLLLRMTDIARALAIYADSSPVCSRLK